MPTPVSPPVPTASPSAGTSGVAGTGPTAPTPEQTPLAARTATPGKPGADAPISPTSDQAVALAVRRNLGILASLNDVFAARSGVRSASALTPPNFFIAPAITPGGTSDAFLFNQPLELNGTRSARTGVAEAQLHLAEAQAVLQLQSLVYAVRSSYGALAGAQQRLGLARDALATAEQFDAIAQKQVALGARPGIEATQTTIEVERAQQQLAQAQGEEQTARIALNALIGVPETQMTEVSVVTAPSETVTPDPASARRRALASRATIAVAAAQRDIPKQQARLDRAQGVPDLAPQVRAGEIVRGIKDAGVGVVLTLPLDYGTRRNRVRQDEQTADAAQDGVVGAQTQALLDADQALARLQTAQTVLAQFGTGLIDNARAVLQASRFGFEQGQTTIIAVLEAQRAYRSILFDRISAQADAAQAQAALDQATGALPPGLLSELERDMRDSRVLGPNAAQEANAQ